AADGLANAAAAVRSDDFQPRKVLKNAAHDQTAERQTQIERPADAGGQPILPHALFAEAEMRRMDHHRNVEVFNELPKRPRFVVVGIMTFVAGMDEYAF